MNDQNIIEKYVVSPLVVLLTFFTFAPAHGANSKLLSQKGALIGGVASGVFTLKGLQLVQEKGGKERLVMSMADRQGQKIKGRPGYYHVEMKDHPRRLIIDLAQTSAPGLNDAFLRHKFQSSKRIQSARLLQDSYDGSMSIELILKNQSKAQVFQVLGNKETGRIVVDLL